MPRRIRTAVTFALALTAGALAVSSTFARQADARFFDAMRWRLVGPNRAGRVSCVAGVPGDATTYYLGTPDGGVWKTTDGGVVWTPIFDAVHAPSIGAIAVAASNADVVYVGTGHNLLGKGVFRSNDAGRTWQAAGLADTKFITALVVDPKNPDIVLAGVGAGGNFGSMVYYNNNPSPARGVYRTTDGGHTWAHVLAVDPASGVIDIVSDANDMRVVFASFSNGGGRGAAPAAGPLLFKSTDGGATWARLNAQGLDNVGSANITVATGTTARRLYVLAGGRGGGVFRSEDGGATWTPGTTQLASASGHLYVDPLHPDVLYTMGTSMYRSTDAGRTLEAVKGAPGGDDNRSLWIDPTNPRRMIIGADQGPTITVNGGASWTPWYVVQNGEHYFVTTDDQFPYWIYAAQQDSGTVAIRSRSDYGAIRPNDWYPVSGYEQGHIFADPFNPRYVYSHGGGHTVLRFDRDTGQVGPIYVPKAQDRFGPRPAMALSPKDPHIIFLGAQYVMKTIDRGTAWTTISPDLTGGNGTLVAFAPSPLDEGILWTGSSTGLIHLTRDGGQTWKDVSPPDLKAAAATLTLWSMDASWHDAGVAYASAIDISDTHAPHFYRTVDFGEHWQAIVQGLDADVPTRVVREDPVRPNLLYGGTQSGAWVSLDRGDHWQPLQLSLPTVAVNDITVHNEDVVIATWGRALWILDDVTPLRQIEAARSSTGGAFLFEPAPAMRARWDVNQDTPVPPEVTSGRNPPDGAILDYYLGAAASGPITLSITDAGGDVVRTYSNAAPALDTTMPNVPMYWFKPADAERLPSTAGMHRLAWDLRYPTPPSLNYGADGNPATSTSYGIIAPAILGQSPRQQPLGPLALPGTYRVRLTVGGRAYERPLTVKADPRVNVSLADLSAQLGWQRAMLAGITSAHDAIASLRALRAAAADRRAASSGNAAVAAAVQAFDRAALAAIAGLAGNRALASHLSVLENADMKPNDSTVAVLQTSCAGVADTLAKYRQVVQQELGTVNAALTAARLTPLPAPGPVGAGCGR